MNLKFLNPRVIVQSIINAIDISNRANRELGVVQSITDNVTVDGEVDVSDNTYRELGVVQSITDTVNTQLTGRNKALAIDGDNALIASTLEEYYLDSGAYFEFGATDFLSVPAFDNDTPGQLQFELECGAELVRIFGFSVSTLSNKFKMEVWETDTRDVSDNEAEEDITEYPPFLSNRNNLKDCPGALYKLEGYAEHDLAEAGYELIFSDAFIMQEGGGGPHATDIGGVGRSATALQLAQKNYIFRIVNFDDEVGGREFAVTIHMGVSALLEEV